jgi:hypothetical protein
MDKTVVDIPQGSIIVCTPKRPERLWGHPASYSVVISGVFLGVRATGA